MLKERDEVFNKLYELLECSDVETKLSVYEELLETGSVTLTSLSNEEAHSFSITQFSHRLLDFDEIENDWCIDSECEDDLEVLEVSEDVED